MKRSRRLYLVVAGAVLLVFFLIGTGLQDTMVYYVTVGELKASSQEYAGRGLRINGIVKTGSLIETNGTSHEFVLQADGDELVVRYEGILPDTFKDNHDVLIEGRYLGDGVFAANQIFTKCASKYDAEPEYEHPVALPKEES